MNYDGELRLLCDTFNKCRVPTAFLKPGDLSEKITPESLLFGDRLTDDFLASLTDKTIYLISGPLKFSRLVLRLPRLSEETFLAIGPYLSAPLSSTEVLEIAEKNRIAPDRRKLLKTYYANLPILPQTSHLHSLLDTFAERIWGANQFNFEELIDGKSSVPSPLPANKTSKEDTLANMKLMEERYAAENNLIRAVSKGQMHLGSVVLDNLSSAPFEKRLDDPLRNLKNYSIIMNTLLRKAAEQGGVHPLYIDEVSSDFAMRIEQAPSVIAIRELMGELFRTYCHLVRKHSMKGYSPTVQKTLALIDNDLAADLSLKNLAEAQKMSPAYLSAAFKRETGKTLTDYITSERMGLAAHLLETTNLQVQTVAAHCGILDVQYFSKLFKKHTKKTPKEYRESLK
jgi:AraC-like DNA-binding protein